MNWGAMFKTFFVSGAVAAGVRASLRLVGASDRMANAVGMGVGNYVGQGIFDKHRSLSD